MCRRPTVGLSIRPTRFPRCKVEGEKVGIAPREVGESGREGCRPHSSETAGASSKYFSSCLARAVERSARTQRSALVAPPSEKIVSFAAEHCNLPPDPMILAAYICEHGAIVSQATNHATSPDGAGATLDSLLRARVQELSQVGGSAAVKRVMVRRHDEYLLFVLVQGAHAYVCACTNAPERAFAAFCFLADVCVRWSNQTERPAFESVLRAQMVHYSSANLIGAELLRAPNEPALGGSDGGGAVAQAQADAQQARNELEETAESINARLDSLSRPQCEDAAGPGWARPPGRSHARIPRSYAMPAA